MDLLTDGPRRAHLPRAAGIAGLFSGAALIAHIVSGVSLRLALALTAGVLLAVAGSAWRRARPGQRARLIRFVKVGFVAGSLATVVYDVTRFALSQLDPSPYNPFEAIRVFGVLLAGSSAGVAAVYAAGTAFHLLNGMSFGIAYCFFFGGGGIISGIIWGLVLELFQLTLYPGWLDIRFYREFVQISGLSHVAYGATLGLSCRYGLRAGARAGTVP